MHTIRRCPLRVIDIRQGGGTFAGENVATFTSGVTTLGMPYASMPSIYRKVFFMHPLTRASMPSLPRYSSTASAPTTGAPGRVPERVNSCFTVR